MTGTCGLVVLADLVASRCSQLNLCFYKCLLCALFEVVADKGKIQTRIPAPMPPNPYFQIFAVLRIIQMRCYLTFVVLIVLFTNRTWLTTIVPKEGFFKNSSNHELEIVRRTVFFHSWILPMALNNATWRIKRNWLHLACVIGCQFGRGDQCKCHRFDRSRLVESPKSICENVACLMESFTFIFKSSFRVFWIKKNLISENGNRTVHTDFKRLVSNRLSLRPLLTYKEQHFCIHLDNLPSLLTKKHKRN